MLGFLLRRNIFIAAYPDDFLVLLPLDDGYELKVGHLSKQAGADMNMFWAWACPGATGREETLEAAIAAFRDAWRSTDDDLAKMRIAQTNIDTN